MMWYYFNNLCGNGMWGGLMMFLFWAAIILLLVWFIKTLTVKHPSNSNKALDILKERYAKGEINKEDFETRKKDLL